MRRAVAVLLSALGISVFLFAATPQEAQAGPPCDIAGICGAVYHYPERNHNELERPLAVRCNFGDPSSEQFVPRGEWDRCKDVDQIYVYPGEDLWCRTPGGVPDIQWEDATATGWKKVNDFFSRECAYKPDWA